MPEERGIEKGIAIGEDRGIEKGREEGKIFAAKEIFSLLKQGFTIEEVEAKFSVSCTPPIV